MEIEMEIPDMYFDKNEYIETISGGNKVCRRTTLYGTQNIVLGGKVIIHSDVIMRGDLSNVETGQYCIIGRQSVIRSLGIQLIIGSHVYIGESSIINSSHVGSYVYVGYNVVMGRRCVLQDCCFIADNSVLAPETIVSSYMKFEGSPAKCVGELPECTADSMIEFTKNYYENFKPAINITQMQTIQS